MSCSPANRRAFFLRLSTIYLQCLVDSATGNVKIKNRFLDFFIWFFKNQKTEGGGHKKKIKGASSRLLFLIYFASLFKNWIYKINFLEHYLCDRRKPGPRGKVRNANRDFSLCPFPSVFCFLFGKVGCARYYSEFIQGIFYIANFFFLLYVIGNNV